MVYLFTSSAIGSERFLISLFSLLVFNNLSLFFLVFTYTMPLRRLGIIL